LFTAEFSSDFSINNSALTVKVKPNFFEITCWKVVKYPMQQDARLVFSLTGFFSYGVKKKQPV
jgi:hypothetical protein